MRAQRLAQEVGGALDNWHSNGPFWGQRPPRSRSAYMARQPWSTLASGSRAHEQQQIRAPWRALRRLAHDLCHLYPLTDQS